MPTHTLEDLQSMSDQELRQVNPHDLIEPEQTTEPETVPTHDTEAAPQEVDTPTDETSASEPERNEPVDEPANGNVSSQEQGEANVFGEQSAKDATNQSNNPEKNPLEKLLENPSDLSTEQKVQWYEAVTSGFRAAGSQVKVSSPEEAIRLMQQGVDYHRKMNQLQPMRKAWKLLEENNLTDESSLAFLVDVHNKDPEAIAKLIKDSGIETYDLPDDVSGYTPKQGFANDNQILVDDTVAEALTTPHGQRAMNVIMSEWDPQSKQYFADNPAEINALSEHVRTGVFDHLNQILTTQRALGNVPPHLNNIQAYLELYSAYKARETQQKQQEASKVVTTVSPKQAAVNPAAKAAAPSGGSPSSNKVATKNFLEMSTEEFMAYQKSVKG